LLAAKPAKTTDTTTAKPHAAAPVVVTLHRVPAKPHAAVLVVVTLHQVPSKPAPAAAPTPAKPPATRWLPQLLLSHPPALPSARPPATK
jgi:hypothetical protein